MNILHEYLGSEKKLTIRGIDSKNGDGLNGNPSIPFNPMIFYMIFFRNYLNILENWPKSIGNKGGYSSVLLQEKWGMNIH